jgi:hypothetical protein
MADQPSLHREFRKPKPQSGGMSAAELSLRRRAPARSVSMNAGQVASDRPDLEPEVPGPSVIRYYRRHCLIARCLYPGAPAARVGGWCSWGHLVKRQAASAIFRVADDPTGTPAAHHACSSAVRRGKGCSRQSTDRSDSDIKYHSPASRLPSSSARFEVSF